MDLTATDCAELSDVSVRSVNAMLLPVRRRLAEHCETISPLGGKLEADEWYFGARRVRGVRGRGDRVYTKIVPDATKRTLQAIIGGRADIASVIHTDGWCGYDGLVDVGFNKHHRVNHGIHEFARGSVHVNGIESFWSYAKRRLVKFKGVPRHTFYLHLKETKFRFNHRHAGVYKALLSLLKSNPL